MIKNNIIKAVKKAVTSAVLPEYGSTTSVAPYFYMKFDDIANADLMIGGDSSDVADWNTFFNLPTNGTPFDSVTVNGNEVTLNGGGNMTLSAYLFGDNEPTGTSLLEVEDNGVTVACGDGVFSDYNVGSGCYGLTSVILPSLNINNTKEVFADCESLAELSIDFDAIITLGDDSFDYVPVLPQYSFPNLQDASGFNCFALYNNLINPIFPSLIIIGNGCFALCSGLISINMPSLTTITGDLINYGAFQGSTSLETISMPSCNSLGITVGDDNVFKDVLGQTITLTVPSALMTCNGGNPDGDIAYLQANNTVTIVTV